jgi:hypothetical protein
VALSTNQKIAIAVGVTAAVVLVGAYAFAKPPPKETPPPRPKGLDFDTRNVDALNAVVDAIIADPQLREESLTMLADRLSYYGLFEQEMRIRAKHNPQLQLQLASSQFSGFATR